jgi:hypothetical protein
MTPGSTVGLVPREGSGIQPGKHVAGLANTGGEEVPMMAWTIADGGMVANRACYRGPKDTKVDLLLVVGERARDELGKIAAEDGLPTIKRLIRSGDILFFVFRTKFELQDAGYEDFLDTLGLAFLGACR